MLSYRLIIKLVIEAFWGPWGGPWMPLGAKVFTPCISSVVMLAYNIWSRLEGFEIFPHDGAFLSQEGIVGPHEGAHGCPWEIYSLHCFLAVLN